MIGFDIGTTQSKIAYVDPTGAPSIINNERGEPQTPSVVYLQPGGTPLVGTDAIEQGYVDSSRCLRNFKLQLGTNQSLLTNGEQVTPTDATSMLIANLKNTAEQVLGKAVDEAVVTCPANFRDDSKEALLEAFERNGIHIHKLVPEPTAAGLAYALNKTNRSLTFLVYDFGGGTFDVSVLRIDGEEVSVLSTEGIPELGGNDLNEPIRKRMVCQVAARSGEMPTRQDEPLFYQEVDAKSETTKKSLCNRAQVPCVIGYKGGQVVVEFTQEDYRREIDPMVIKTLEMVDKAIQEASLSVNEIDRLLMVGGSSRIPYIQQKVGEHTGLTPRVDVDPLNAVAYGAALACVSEMDKQGRTATLRGRVIPVPEMFVRDVTAHGVGCCVVDVSNGRKRLVNSVIIPKNTSIPCHKKDQFYLEDEEQIMARIEILQGEADADRDDCLSIGEIVLDDLPKESKRTPRMLVEYRIDVNGMVTAMATDKVSGKQQSVSVDYKKGIQPKEKLQAV